MMGARVSLYSDGTPGPQGAFRRDIFELDTKSPCCTALPGVGQFSAQIKGGDRAVSPRLFPQNSRKLFFHGADR